MFNGVRGGIAIGCLYLLCEGRRTQVDVRTYVFETRVVFRVWICDITCGVYMSVCMRVGRVYERMIDVGLDQ